MDQKPTNVDDYVKKLPEDTQITFNKMRRHLKQILPGANEVISYSIPCLKVNGAYLVYFAAWKTHISLYPLPKGDESFQKIIAPYKTGKGTVQFPLKEPIPYAIVTQIVSLLKKERDIR